MSNQITRKIGVEVEDTFYSKEEIIRMDFNSLKMFLSFIEDVKTLDKICQWHSEEAVDYSQELQRTLNY